MISLDVNLSSSDAYFQQVGTVHAIKIGFAGCLSTVSTFIAEFSFLLSSIHPINGYHYTFIFFMCTMCSSIHYTLIIDS